MKTNKTKRPLVSSAILLSMIVPAHLQARNNDFTEFSQVQKQPSGQADARAAASYIQADQENGASEAQSTSSGFALDVLAQPKALQGLTLGIQAQQLEQESSLKSKSDASEFNQDDSLTDLNASASYGLAVGEAQIRLGYAVSNSVLKRGKVEVKDEAGLLQVSTDQKENDLNFVRHQISAAVDVDRFTVGIDYGTSDKEERRSAQYSYLPSQVSLFGRVALTDQVALGAAFTQNNFDNLEASDKDEYRNYQAVQLAATYNQDKLIAQARLGTSGTEDKTLEDYTEWQGEGFVGYRILPALEVGGSLTYGQTSYRFKEGTGDKVETDFVGLGLQATYSI